MKNNSIKVVVATGIGAALFVIIGMFINIPLFANTSIQLQYAVQAFLAVIFGPVVGFFIGLIGHMVKDMFAGYGIWWSWVIPSGLVGLGIGFLRNRLHVEKGIFSTKDVAWGGIAPLGDIIIFKEPASKVFVQGLLASVANALTVGVGATILLAIYAKSRTQAGSLSKD